MAARGKSGAPPTAAAQKRTKYRRSWLLGERPGRLAKDLKTLLVAHQECKKPGPSVVMRDYLYMIHRRKPRLTVEERDPVDVTRDLSDEEMVVAREFFAEFDAEAQVRYGGDYINERDDFIAQLERDAKLHTMGQQLDSNHDVVVGKLDAHHAEISDKLNSIKAGKCDILSAVGELKTLISEMKQQRSLGVHQSGPPPTFQWATLSAEDRAQALANLQHEMHALTSQTQLDRQLVAQRAAEQSSDAEKAARQAAKELKAAEKQRKIDEKAAKKDDMERKRAEKKALGTKRKSSTGSTSARGNKKLRCDHLDPLRPDFLALMQKNFDSSSDK